MHYSEAGRDGRMDLEHFALFLRDVLMATGLTQRQADDRVCRSYMGNTKYSDLIFKKMLQQSQQNMGDRCLTFDVFFSHEYSRLNLIPRTNQQIFVAEEFFASWTERPIGFYPATQSQDDILVRGVSQKPSVKRASTKVYPTTPRYRSSQLLPPLDDEPVPESAFDLGSDAKPVSMLSMNQDDFIPQSVATDSPLQSAAETVDAVNSRYTPDHLNAAAQFGDSSVSVPVFLGVRSPRSLSEGAATFPQSFSNLHDDYDTKSEHNSVQGVPLLSRSSSVSAHQQVLPWHEWAAQRAALAQSLDRKNVANAKFVDRMTKARGVSSTDLYHPTTSATEVRSMLNRAGSRMNSDRALIPRLRLAQTPVGSNALSLPETVAQGTLGHSGLS